jgi:hypothetical protein
MNGELTSYEARCKRDLKPFFNPMRWILYIRWFHYGDEFTGLFFKPTR